MSEAPLSVQAQRHLASANKSLQDPAVGLVPYRDTSLIRNRPPFLGTP